MSPNTAFDVTSSLCAETIGSSPLRLDVRSELEKYGCLQGTVAAILKALAFCEVPVAQMCPVQWY